MITAMSKDFELPASILQYEPKRLSEEEMSKWQKLSLSLFGRNGSIQNPYIDITLQLSIDSFFSYYQTHFRSKQKKYTFFSFLSWNLVQTLKSHQHFQFRQFGNEWYILKNAPIFIPVAVGGEDRFSEILLKNVNNLNFEDFNDLYQAEVEKARLGQVQKNSELDFRCSNFIGNLPHLEFSALTLHWSQDNFIGQNFFYFGKRYLVGSELKIPLAIKIHHGPCDPYVLNFLLEDFMRRAEVQVNAQSKR